MSRLMRLGSFFTLTVVATLTASAADMAAITISAPLPHQVHQREGYVPQRSGPHEPGGAALGFADVLVRGSWPEAPQDSIAEYRLVLLAQGAGRARDWTPWPARPQAGEFATTLRVAAGGWYRLELRTRRGEQVVALGTLEPLGVGEVFLVAGQSYATNCNDEPWRVADTAGRVVAFDSAKSVWRVAHDPQPAPDGSVGGSIWPPLGDLLVPLAGVPIGFANVAVGATSSTQWLPEGELHRRLVAAGQSLGRFRAVLWQQGESDVIGKVATKDYVANLQAIRGAAVKAWGFQPPWLLAKSTLHPTVYADPAGETRIRRAIDELCRVSGFRPGPDTDLLSGENRGGPMTRRHFSAVGQRNAAALWFAAIWREISAPRPDHETVLAALPELRLRELSWSAPIVWRESSVLLQDAPAGPLTARLAFPAAEVLEVATADRQRTFTAERHYSLSPDGLTLVFSDPGPVPVISSSEFFPPPDAPNSYKHRLSNPDQNLLYRPGQWFHERNVEFTYRRRADAAPAITDVDPARQLRALLPNTHRRLAAREPFTLGISGDSISTGLDASALSLATPNQPGYPDLIAAQLQSEYGMEVALRNRSVSGWSVANGVADLEALLAERPQLIIVAYGMNDVGRRDPAWFAEQTKVLVERVRQASPDTELILVAPMLGHGEWIHTPREMFAQYRDQLLSLTGPGVALADLTEVWTILLKNKHDLDLTGNGLNHPNDFGHRLYAQAILQCLAPPQPLAPPSAATSSSPNP